MRLGKSSGVLGLGAALLLMVVLGLGLLYAYRSQSPAVQMVPFSNAMAALDSGRLRSVVIEDGRAHLTFTDGSRQDAALPDDGNQLVHAISAHNASDPAHPVDLAINNSGSPGVAGFFVTLIVTLLPILLLVALVLLAASAFTRSRAPQRYEALARIADLRDRGVLSEEEFQREKHRLLK